MRKFDNSIAKRLGINPERIYCPTKSEAFWFRIRNRLETGMDIADWESLPRLGYTYVSWEHQKEGVLTVDTITRLAGMDWHKSPNPNYPCINWPFLELTKIVDVGLFAMRGIIREHV